MKTIVKKYGGTSIATIKRVESIAKEIVKLKKKNKIIVVLSEDTLLADAAATAICNIVKTKEDIKKGIKFASSIKKIIGTLIIIDNTLGSWGKIEIER